MARRVNGRQEIFCQHIANGESGSRAAIIAGYSEKNSRIVASENLTKPYIVARIKELQAERREKDEVTLQWWRDKVKSIAAKAEEEGDLANANRAMDMLGKHVNAYERHQHAGATIVPTYDHIAMSSVQARLRSGASDEDDG